MSVLGKELTPEPILLDVVRELRKRGRYKEADHWLYVIPIMLSAKGIYPEDAFVMTVDEIQWELNKPLSPPGWDNTWWGKSVVCPT